MEEVGDEEAVIVSLLAFDSDTRAPFVQAVLVRAVDAEADDASLRINRKEAHRGGIVLALVTNISVGRVGRSHPVEAAEERLSHVGVGQRVRHGEELV